VPPFSLGQFAEANEKEASGSHPRKGHAQPCQQLQFLHFQSQVWNITKIASFFVSVEWMM
jgi:hypothetical protein